eukprot:m.324545 g.324545  ORF g.324545 m.324545 type:complete len:74 (-) comp16011_c0_seq1:3179-3400(-)
MRRMEVQNQSSLHTFQNIRKQSRMNLAHTHKLLQVLVREEQKIFSITFGFLNLWKVLLELWLGGGDPIDDLLM